MRISTNTIAITMTMGNKKASYRKDIISGKVFPKDELVRLAKIDEKIVLDASHSMLGRGVYLRYNKENIDALKNGKILNKAFHSSIEPNEITSLLERLDNER